MIIFVMILLVETSNQKVIDTKKGILFQDLHFNVLVSETYKNVELCLTVKPESFLIYM